ncbi:MAG: amidohydrolase, partial [Candidatus Bipolaricaulia bacterium]
MIRLGAILIENALIWTNDDRLIKDGFVVIQGDSIKEVGEMEELPRSLEEGAEIIDAQGRLLLPGFVCA